MITINEEFPEVIPTACTYRYVRTSPTAVNIPVNVTPKKLHMYLCSTELV